MHRAKIACILIGGMNFLLRHRPIVTFDIDLWVEDGAENLCRCERALAELEAAWGATDEAWGPVAALHPGWLSRQALFCLASPWGAIDIFRNVLGLEDFRAALARAVPALTAGGVPYRGLCDEDMLRSQLALDERERSQDRIRILREAIEARRVPGNSR
jgi:hypothetical protein